MSKLEDMATWNKQHNKKSCNYTNKDVLERVIRYITRTRINENRLNELICVGGSGIHLYESVDYIISEFEYVQNLYGIGKRKGRRLAHIIYSLNNEEFEYLNDNYALVDLIAREMSAYFFRMGFQNIYAIHHDNVKSVHIHMVINSINFLTGLKYHSGCGDIERLKALFDRNYDMAYLIAKSNNGSEIRKPIFFTLCDPGYVPVIRQ